MDYTLIGLVDDALCVVFGYLATRDIFHIMCTEKESHSRLIKYAYKIPHMTLIVANNDTRWETELLCRARPAWLSIIGRPYGMANEYPEQSYSLYPEIMQRLIRLSAHDLTNLSGSGLTNCKQIYLEYPQNIVGNNGAIFPRVTRFTCRNVTNDNDQFMIVLARCMPQVEKITLFGKDNKQMGYRYGLNGNNPQIIPAKTLILVGMRVYNLFEYRHVTKLILIGCILCDSHVRETGLSPDSAPNLKLVQIGGDCTMRTMKIWGVIIICTKPGKKITTIPHDDLAHPNVSMLSNELTNKYRAMMIGTAPAEFVDSSESDDENNYGYSHSYSSEGNSYGDYDHIGCGSTSSSDY